MADKVRKTTLVEVKFRIEDLIHLATLLEYQEHDIEADWSPEAIAGYRTVLKAARQQEAREDREAKKLLRAAKGPSDAR